MHNPCAVIPVYNHETAITTVVDALLAQGLPCILVDDASEPSCARVLDALAERDGVFLVRLTANQGKGGAVMTGLRTAMPCRSMPTASTICTTSRASSANPAPIPRR